MVRATHAPSDAGGLNHGPVSSVTQLRKDLSALKQSLSPPDNSLRLKRGMKVMSDGREEREERKIRREQEKRENREDVVESAEVDEWEPERDES